MVFGYCRVSTTHQRITRQITNIMQVDPSAVIVKEFYTGTTQTRPQWEKLMGKIQRGDTIIFDSVSRMSRNAEEGFKDYKALYEKGVNLIFINEPAGRPKMVVSFTETPFPFFFSLSPKIVLLIELFR